MITIGIISIIIIPTNDGKSNMRLLQHRHIVPAVPNCCSQVGRVRIFQQQNEYMAITAIMAMMVMMAITMMIWQLLQSGGWTGHVYAFSLSF